MPTTVQLYWSFRSPYCYLVMPRVRALAAERDVEIDLRPVYPLAIRHPDVFVGAPPQRGTYPVLDRRRVAEHLGVPFADPDPDPVRFDADRRASADQPYIHRLTRLGADAVREGRGLAYFDEVSKLIWSGAVKGWDRGGHMAGAARRAGLDLAAMDRRIAADAAGYDADMARNYETLKAAGHWGVPTLVVDGEPFFGQDRFDYLVRRLDRMGVGRRLRGSGSPASGRAPRGRTPAR